MALKAYEPQGVFSHPSQLERALSDGSMMGLFGIGEKKIKGKEEQGIYRSLGMDWIELALQKDWGEIEASKKGRLPIYSTPYWRR